MINILQKLPIFKIVEYDIFYLILRRVVVVVVVVMVKNSYGSTRYYSTSGSFREK